MGPVSTRVSLFLLCYHLIASADPCSDTSSAMVALCAATFQLHEVPQADCTFPAGIALYLP